MSEVDAGIEAEAADLIPEIGDQTGAETAHHDASGETDEALELEALAMGWKPESQFKGPKDKFVSAAEYVERGKTIMPFLRKELSQAYKKIEGLEKSVTSAVQHLSAAEKRGYEKARRDLEAELDAAAAAGNVTDVRAITQEIVDLDKEVTAAPKAETPGSVEFTAWKDDNAWYGTDKALSAAFDALCAEVHAEGYTSPKAGLKEATARIKAEFPQKFAKAPNPARLQPGAVEAAGGARRPSGKTYADLPPAAKQMCDEFVKDIPGFTRDKYLKNYDWS